MKNNWRVSFINKTKIQKNVIECKNVDKKNGKNNHEIVENLNDSLISSTMSNTISNKELVYNTFPKEKYWN